MNQEITNIVAQNSKKLIKPTERKNNSTDMNSSLNPIMLKGIPSSSGIAIAPVKVIQPDNIVSPLDNIETQEIPKEIIRFHNALDELVEESEKVLEKIAHGNQNVVSIFKANIELIKDPFFSENIENKIKEAMTAESAILKVFDVQKRFYEHSRDELVRDRFIELDHLKNRLLSVLRNQCFLYSIAKDSIIVAKSITPAEIVNLYEAGALGVITEVGGIASHSSILARSFEIPAVIGLKNAVSLIEDDSTVIIDGYTGLVISNPDNDTLERYRHKKSEEEQHKVELGELKKFPSVTTDGVHIALKANIEKIQDIHTAIINGAEGSGLVRTESLVTQKNYIPDEEEQYEWYKEIADSSFPHPVTIRVFDFGSDKFSEGMKRKEPNPDLGFRGIRYLLSRRDILVTQLRAILRASKHKNIHIMLPMVSNLREVIATKEILEECKQSLKSEGKHYHAKIPFGIMIETPAAALMADSLAQNVDFFSIGTNDLTQYTIAADRNNELVSHLFDPFHLGVLKLIKMTTIAAKNHNIPVSVCGELAGHFTATPILVGFGVSELSVAPPLILELKGKIRSINYEKARLLSDEVLKLNNQDEILALIEKEFTY